MVSTLEQMQVPNGTGPGDRRSKNKAVMCEKFPQRNKELDAYLTHIIDVA